MGITDEDIAFDLGFSSVEVAKVFRTAVVTAHRAFIAHKEELSKTAEATEAGKGDTRVAKKAEDARAPQGLSVECSGVASKPESDSDALEKARTKDGEAERLFANRVAAAKEAHVLKVAEKAAAESGSDVLEKARAKDGEAERLFAIIVAKAVEAHERKVAEKAAAAEAAAEASGASPKVPVQDAGSAEGLAVGGPAKESTKNVEARKAAERIAAKKAADEKAALEKLEAAQQAAAEKASKAAAKKAAADTLAAERAVVSVERAERKVIADRIAADRVAIEKTTAETAAAAKVAATAARAAEKQVGKKAEKAVAINRSEAEQVAEPLQDEEGILVEASAPAEADDEVRAASSAKGDDKAEVPSGESADASVPQLATRSPAVLLESVGGETVDAGGTDGAGDDAAAAAALAEAVATSDPKGMKGMRGAVVAKGAERAASFKATAASRAERASRGSRGSSQGPRPSLSAGQPEGPGPPTAGVPAGVSAVTPGSSRYFESS